MSATPAAISGIELKSRIVEFARGASVEITTHDENLVPAVASVLAPESVVYVAHTPTVALADVVRVARRVQEAGLEACPHIVARRIESRRALQDAAEHLAEAGVTRALVVGGDNGKPIGDFADSLDVLRTEILNRNDITQIGVAGHPEGHRTVGQSALWRSLHDKQSLARRLDIRMHVVTQFGFDPAAILSWERHLADQRIELPVIVGMAGPASLAHLIRYAMQCGVGASLRGALQSMNAMRNVAGLATTPDQMLTGILRAAGESSRSIAGVHLYSFGGTLACARWLKAVIEGRFDLHPDGDRFTVR
jgi:methylenetetrahydrofolate reductase (NADPH)